MSDTDPYLDLLEELKELTLKKRAGYSPGGNPFRNFEQSALFGVDPVKGILIRVMDKISRAASLLENPDNDKIGESLDDNLIDGGNYLLIAAAYRRWLKAKAEREAQGTLDVGVNDGRIVVECCSEGCLLCIPSGGSCCPPGCPAHPGR